MRGDNNFRSSAIRLAETRFEPLAPLLHDLVVESHHGCVFPEAARIDASPEFEIEVRLGNPAPLQQAPELFLPGLLLGAELDAVEVDAGANVGE